ncbi:MAG: hypothetical protein H7138_23360 [Myxococcales bacterium]|nr:hypothetical protein [Myxococcales bacterium]
MVVPRVWKLVMVVALGAAGCSKKVGAAEGAAPDVKPIEVAFTPNPTTGDEVRIVITTEPNVDLYVSSARGSATPVTQRSDTAGKANVFVRGALGANTLEVHARIDKRETKHVYPFTVTTAEKVVFRDATPERAGAQRVGCSGFLQERGKQDVSLCASSLLLADDGSIRITATGGSLVKLTIGDQVFEAKNGALAAQIALTPAIAALDLMFVDKERPLELPATLELTTGTLTGTLELDHAPITAMFMKVKDGPVRFPGEADSAGRSTLLLIGERTWQYAGESAPLGRVDLIALDSSTPRRGTDCQYVAIDGSGKKKSLTRMMRDHTLVVYERRTGKQLATRRWIAKTPACEEWIKSDAPGRYAEVDESDVLDWAKTFVAR